MYMYAYSYEVVRRDFPVFEIIPELHLLLYLRVDLEAVAALRLLCLLLFIGRRDNRHPSHHAPGSP